MFLHLFGLLYIKQSDGRLEFSDGWLILLQYEIYACFDLMNVSQLEDFAVLLLFIWDELVQFLYVLQVLVFWYSFVYSLANTHQNSIALVFVVVGELSVFLEETNR